ncbi:MAG: ISKra4 family transposase [Gammaproteobacteria bacterium]|nr:ISKra4 family transposase [Gammaproteobacteria bacterium]
MGSYRIEKVYEEYRLALQELQVLIGEVANFERQACEHAEVEQHLQRRGPEVMRQLFQCYLNRISAAEEQREVVVGADGAARRYARVRRRQLMSVFGSVEVCRLGYSDHGVGSVFPLDAQLNLPLQYYSHGLRERVGEAVASGSYESAIEQIARHTGGRIAKRQAEEVSQVLAADFEEFYRRRQPAPRQQHPRELVVLSMDGKGIVMRHEDLREHTRQRAEGAAHKLSSRLSRGEKRNHKRMASVAAVYEVALHVRSAEQIMVSESKAARPGGPKPTNKRVWASVEHSVPEVMDEVFAETRRRDPRGERHWVMLVDGHEGQLREVYAAIKRHGASVTVIQDFIHVLEYLWGAAWCLYEEGDPCAEQWVKERAIAILQSKSSAVAAGMRRSATRRGLSQSEREPLDKCAEYLLKNRERLDYAHALKEGLPIATGVIEGACRHLVKQRMECSGARWSLKGAEAVLRLRALRMSGDWDDYMVFHKRTERLRNHPACYDQQRKVA